MRETAGLWVDWNMDGGSASLNKEHNVSVETVTAMNMKITAVGM
jgi:hypothetical protein